MRRAIGAVIALGLVAGLVMPSAALAAFLSMKTARTEIRRTVAMPGISGIRVNTCKRLNKSKVRCRVHLRRWGMRCHGVGEATRPTRRDLYGHAWAIRCRR
jgi:hypothetical protein